MTDVADKSILRGNVLPESNESGSLGVAGQRWKDVRAKTATIDTITFATPISPASGGTGIDTSASTGVPIVTAGTWTVPATLPVADGGTGQASTSAGYIKGGATFSVQATPIPVGDGGTGTNSTLSGYLKGGSPITAQSTPLPAADLGTGAAATTVLHGNQTFAGVALGAGGDVTGTLPVGSGGTGQTATSAGYVKGGNPMTIQATPIPAADLGSGSPGATTFLRGDQTYTVPVLSSLINSLSGDVPLNNTASYFDGPSVAQGVTGTWFVSGTVTIVDSVNPTPTYLIKLWDGTTVIASTVLVGPSAGSNEPVALSGVITAPAGNLRISVRDSSATTGNIKFNASGNSKDSTITAVRIA